MPSPELLLHLGNFLQDLLSFSKEDLDGKDKDLEKK